MDTDPRPSARTSFHAASRISARVAARRPARRSLGTATDIVSYYERHQPGCQPVVLANASPRGLAFPRMQSTEPCGRQKENMDAEGLRAGARWTRLNGDVAPLTVSALISGVQRSCRAPKPRPGRRRWPVPASSPVPVPMRPGTPLHSTFHVLWPATASGTAPRRCPFTCCAGCCAASPTGRCPAPRTRAARVPPWQAPRALTTAIRVRDRRAGAAVRRARAARRRA